jgi:DNA-binding MarR family transcriptional regulator
MKRIEDIINTNFHGEHHKAVVNVRYSSNFIGHFYTTQFAKYELSLPQFNILRILRGTKETISIKTVKDRMIEKSPNTTRLIDKLIAKDLIKRSRGRKDKRVVYVSITEKGLKTLEDIDNQFEEMYFSKNLTEEEASTLNYLLDKFRSELTS